MPSRSILLTTLALAVPLLASVALADVYKCTTPQGPVVYQGQPCTGSEAPIIESSGAVSPPAPQSQQSTGTSSPRPPAEGAVPPIELRFFGAIRPGMTEAEVTQRLGPPLRLIDDGIVEKTMQMMGPGLSVGSRTERHFSVWIYPGPAQLPELRVTFASGLVEKTNAQ
jgi:hypothetical protein